jgi:predicted nucleic acid-binding Zn ribbon protein
MVKSELFRDHIFMQRPNHDMQPIGRALEGVVSRSLRKASAGDGPLLAWPLACGSAVAARTRALDFHDGVLRVEVADAGWRRELRELAPRYVAQINKFCADDVARIEFIVVDARKPNG